MPRKNNRKCLHDRRYNCVELPHETIPEEEATHEDCMECIAASTSTALKRRTKKMQKE